MQKQLPVGIIVAAVAVVVLVLGVIIYKNVASDPNSTPAMSATQQKQYEQQRASSPIAQRLGREAGARGSHSANSQ